MKDDFAKDNLTFPGGAKMRTKSLLLSGIVFLILGLGVLPFKAAGASSPHEPYEITIYTLSVGSTNYLMGVALAELINKHSTWLKARSVEGMNSDAHMKMLAAEPEKRKNTLVFSAISSHWYIETGRMRGANPYSGHRQVACWGSPANGFLSIDPKITKLEDLKGKRVGVDIKPFFSRSELGLSLVRQYVPSDQFRVEHLPPVDGFDALRNGLIDVYYGIGVMKSIDQAIPSPAMQEFLDTTRQKPYFLSPSMEKARAALKSLGGYPSPPITVAPGTFHPKQDVPWTLLAGCLTWGADVAMPDDVAYEIARIHYEYRKRFAEVAPAGAFVSKETVGLFGVPEDRVHPGALKFYKKAGIEIGYLGWREPLDWKPVR
jgi:TRAP transporter TAXI family solute receptor